MEFEGSIVILGDVNDGSEVIAEDNIVVLGCLRGMAHAGAKGNEKAIIAKSNRSPSIKNSKCNKKKEVETEIETESYSYSYINEKGIIEME